MLPRKRPVSRPSADRSHFALSAAASRTAFELLEQRTMLSTVPVVGNVPLLSSNPTASVKLFLDFDGAPAHTWGTAAVPQSPAYDTDGDPTTFNNTGDSNLHTEIDNIRKIWAWVAEKYSPFNIDVTTIDPGAYTDRQALRVIVGGDGSWLPYANGVGGAAGAGGIGDFYTSGSNTVYAFSDSFGGDVKWVANTIAQWSGGAFGLYSQSSYDPVTTKKTTQFNTGTSALAPIMGQPNASQRGLWWYGTSSIADVDRTTNTNVPRMQDDLALIAGSNNGFGYRADDHGNSISGATALSGSGTLTRSGVIEQVTDADYFSFTTGGGSVSISGAVAQYGAMLDLKLAVYNASGAQVGSADSSSLGESLTLSLASGTYYIRVSGHGWVNCVDANGVNKGQGADVGQYTLSITGAGGTTSSAPSAPTSLAASAISSSQINLFWTDTSSNETGFKLERATDANFTQGLVTATLGSNVTSYSASGLSAGTTYYFRVRATNATGESTNTPTASATTQAAATAPAAPTGLSAAVASGGAVTLRWTDNSNNETGFAIQRSTNGGSTWTALTTTVAGATSYTDSGISAGVTYSYRVMAVAGSLQSAVSNVVSVTPVPAAPGGASAVALSTSQIKVAWNAPAGATSYRIERSADGANWSLLVTLSQSTLAYTDSGLAAGTRYYYRIKAEGLGGTSAASATVNATTSSASVVSVPSAPTNIVVTSAGKNKNRITWTDTSSNEDGFYLECSKDGTNWTRIATLSSNTTSFTHSGIKRGTYWYRVASFNSAGQSAWLMPATPLSR